MTHIDSTQSGPESQGIPPRIGRESQPAPEDGPGQHQPSHLNLIDSVPHYGPRSDRLPLSVVFVPNGRPIDQSAVGLGLASQCAEQKDAWFVIIRSGDATKHPFPQHLAPATGRPTVVIDLPPRPGRLLPVARSGRRKVSTLHRRSDLGLKRNLLLLISQLCGWESALMLDDDITVRRASQIPRQPTHIPAQVSLRLDDTLADFLQYPMLRAAGYLQRDFNDNSVVCHVRNLLGLPQDGFISGGALVIRCAADLPFFPSSYNEDWQFFFILMTEAHHTGPSSSVKHVGTVHQRPYYPFSIRRARAEELGDVLAEGLFALVGLPIQEVFAQALSSDYWANVIWSRQSMIIEMIGKARGDHSEPISGILGDAEASLRAAFNVYDPAKSWNQVLASYCQALFHDLSEWRDLLTGITPAPQESAMDLPDALELLGLKDHTTWIPSRGARPALHPVAS